MNLIIFTNIRVNRMNCVQSRRGRFRLIPFEFSRVNNEEFYWTRSYHGQLKVLPIMADHKLGHCSKFTLILLTIVS